jgi:hypothetical protein
MNLNTKGVGYAGILSFVVGLLTYGPFQSALTAAVGTQAAQWVGLVFIVAGFAAAYLGMPHNVPTGSAVPNAPTQLVAAAPAAAPPSAPADTTKGS